MKRWGLLVTAFYLVALVVISLPVTAAAFWGPEMNVYDMLEMYQQWEFWIWISIMLCGEALLLFVPVRYADRRLKSRRPLLVPIITSGFFLGILLFVGLLSISAGMWGDKGPAFLSNVPEEAAIAGFCIVPVIFWIAWGIIFYSRTEPDDPNTVIRRATSWMIKGSILEFLIAVPCHIAARRRDDCCAPIGTFLGIAAGISIMLMSFGPGVFFLFKARLKQLQPKKELQ
jgi:hypothetical protein